MGFGSFVKKASNVGAKIGGTAVGYGAAGPLGAVGGYKLGEFINQKIPGSGLGAYGVGYELFNRAFPNMEAPIAPGLIDESLREQIEKKRKARENALEEARLAEEGLRKRLMSQTGLTESAIDKQTAQIIEDTGIGRGLERRAIGAQQAQAGLLRSGFTGQRLQASRLGELKQKAQARASAFERKAGVRRQVSETLQDIDKRRQEMRAQLDEAELNTLTSADYEQRVAQEKLNFNQFLTDLQLGSDQESALLGIIGSLGGIGGMIAGYNLAGGSTPSSTTQQSSSSEGRTMQDIEGRSGPQLTYG